MNLLTHRSSTAIALCLLGGAAIFAPTTLATPNGGGATKSNKSDKRSKGAKGSKGSKGSSPCDPLTTPLKANAGEHIYPADVPGTVTLDGSSSTGCIASYDWVWSYYDAGTKNIVSYNATGPMPTFTFTSASDFVDLTVTDTQGATDVTTICVCKPSPPGTSKGCGECG